MARRLILTSSTLIENLVAMTLVAIAVSGFYHVTLMIQVQWQKERLKHAAMLDVNTMFNHIENKLRYNDTAVIKDSFIIDLRFEEFGDHKVKGTVNVLKASGDTLFQRSRIYGKQ